MYRQPVGWCWTLLGGSRGARSSSTPGMGGDNQLWRLEDGRLVNKTGMVADIAEASMEEGARVIAWERHDGLNQKWSLKENCIHSQLTDMVMDLKEGGMEPGTEVIMFTKHGGNNQRWFIYPA